MTGFMKLKFPIPTTQKTLESWLLYFKECGYEIEEREQGENCVSWFSNAPGYEITPVAARVPCGNGRYSRYLFVRLR